MTVASKTTAESHYYTTYRLNGITYVPHYVKNCYVGPNYSAFEGMHDRNGDRIYFPDESREYTADQLLKAGAVMYAELLWTRARYKPVM